VKKLALRLSFPRVTGRILDVGSGNNPLDIATHLVDSMPDKNAERESDLEVPPGVEFKEGNAENIPFPDQYFDFAHAAHVLEHVESPEKALSELVRVARAGYIETPAAVYEQGAFLDQKVPGWSFHRWYVWAFPSMDRIFFKPKTPSNVKQYCACPAGRFFERLTTLADLKDLDSLMPYHCRMTQFTWIGRIERELWDEGRQGDGSSDCRCFYSAFFEQVRRYFSSWRYLLKRLKLKRKFPVVYAEMKKFLDENEGP
jgi:SAM-dependent methyltransferase